MRVGKSLLIGTVALGVTVGAANPVAQDPPPAAGGRGRQGGPGPAGRGRGPNFPQQQRPLADAGVLARGKGLYESNCAACHGVDLRGGQLGGPNLLRSQLVLSDKAGELIVPVVKGGRLSPPAGAPPMPPFALPDEDIKAIAEFLHSVLAQAGRQGRPPESETVAPEKVLVGAAAAGESVLRRDMQQLPFDERGLERACGSCRRSARAAEPLGLGRWRWSWGWGPKWQ